MSKCPESPSSHDMGEVLKRTLSPSMKALRSSAMARKLAVKLEDLKSPLGTS